MGAGCDLGRAARAGYKFQFVTLAGFHSLNYGMFTLAHEYAKSGGCAMFARVGPGVG